MRVIVAADSEDEAVEAAKQAAEYTLLSHSVTGCEGRDGPCDYVKAMERGHYTSGADRWTRYANTPMAFPADTEKGRDEIRQGWDTTYEELADRLTRIRSRMDEAETVEELANDDGLRMAMSSCRPWTPGVMHHLFDGTKKDNGCWAVSTPDRYEAVVGGELSGKWVVPLDVHF